MTMLWYAVSTDWQNNISRLFDELTVIFIWNLFNAKIELRLFFMDSESYVFEPLWQTTEVKPTELQD